MPTITQLKLQWKRQQSRQCKNILKLKSSKDPKYYRNRAPNLILINVNEQDLDFQTKRLSNWLTKQKATMCYSLETHPKQIGTLLLPHTAWLLVDAILFSIVEIYNIDISFYNISFPSVYS